VATTKRVEFKFDERSLLRCPTCQTPLKAVKQTGGMAMNQYQFDAVKAGDWYCETCPDNGRGQSGLCYWWNSELGITA